MRLKERGIPVEREWWTDQGGIVYIVDLALPLKQGWLPVAFGDRPAPAGGLRFAAEAEPEACLREIQTRLRGSEQKLPWGLRSEFIEDGINFSRS